MAGYLKTTVSPQTGLYSLRHLGSQRSPSALALTAHSIARSGRSFAGQVRSIHCTPTGQVVEGQKMPYQQAMLSLYNRYAGSLSAATVSGPGRQQRPYATSNSPSTVIPQSSGPDGAGMSEPELRSRKRRRQSRSFSSTSSSSSALNDSPDGGHGEKQQPQLNFAELSKIVPQQSPDGASSLWYIVATAAILGFHREPAVGELWHYISSLGGEQSQQLAVARRIREACLKASVLVGFPRVRMTEDYGPLPLILLHKISFPRHKEK